MTITQERLKELLHYDPDTGIFTWKVNRGNQRVGQIVSTDDDKGYIVIGLFYRKYKAHRLAWLYVYGTWPDSHLDHKDQDKSNNRITNLRPATKSQNGQNQSNPRADNTSGFRGVSYHKATGRWEAHICVNGHDKRIGYFITAEQASEAHLAAKKEIHTFWVDKGTL